MVDLNNIVNKGKEDVDLTTSLLWVIYGPMSLTRVL